MKITTKGQVTIPQDVRDRLGLLPGTEMQFEITGDCVLLRKARGNKSLRGRGRAAIRALYGTGTTRMTTDQILALMRG